MKQVVVVLLMLLGVSGAATAAETIRRYDIDIAVQSNGSIEVTENITAQVEGNQIRRGIYRDFPTRYRDRYGNRVVVGLEVLGVERDGQPEPWFTEKVSNGIRINTGNDNFLPAPAEHTFTIRYRTTRQLGFFADHDELYWNAIGTGWVFPIEAASVDARLPVAVPTAQMSVEAYTGYQGTKGSNYAASTPEDGTAHWQLTSPLAPYEGLTIVLTFPKGVIAAPSTGQRVRWFFHDNGGALIAVIGLLALLLFCSNEWRRIGRDPSKGIIIARYEPPEAHSPEILRFVNKMGYDARCFSAAVLQLAVCGCLRIVRESKLLKDEWRLERLSSTPPANVAESKLLERLFKGGAHVLVLKNTNAATVSTAMQEHGRALKAAAQPRYFQLNGWSVAKALALAVLSFIVAVIVAQGSGLVVIFIAAVLSVVALIVFTVLVRAPTPEGRKLMDEIEGLKLYLSVAERDELASMSGPGQPPMLDAKRYERLLPYAVALDVEEAWTKKFTLAVGAAAAEATANNIGWYQGGSMRDLGTLTHAVGSSLSSQISSSSTPPGSSSGSGGGGSSGGGGGGGGGGGR
ncbi:MAG: DUF2207 domain-containing protein [Povalibacter sp.]